MQVFSSSSLQRKLIFSSVGYKFWMVESWSLHMGWNETPLDQELSFCIVIFPIVHEKSSPSKKKTLPIAGKKCPV